MYKKYTGKIYTHTYPFFNEYVDFHVVRLLTKFWWSCPHHIKEWAGLPSCNIIFKTTSEDQTLLHVFTIASVARLQMVHSKTQHTDFAKVFFTSSFHTYIHSYIHSIDPW